MKRSTTQRGRNPLRRAKLRVRVKWRRPHWHNPGYCYYSPVSQPVRYVAEAVTFLQTKTNQAVDALTYELSNLQVIEPGHFVNFEPAMRRRAVLVRSLSFLVGRFSLPTPAHLLSAGNFKADMHWGKSEGFRDNLRSFKCSENSCGNFTYRREARFETWRRCKLAHCRISFSVLGQPSIHSFSSVGQKRVAS